MCWHLASKTSSGSTRVGHFWLMEFEHTQFVVVLATDLRALGGE
jgi:hypothetical protein